MRVWFPGHLNQQKQTLFCRCDMQHPMEFCSPPELAILLTDGCHHCRHTGHFASRCMYNMPQHVKDYIVNSRSLSPPHDRSSHKHQASSPHPNQSSSKHQASSARVEHSFTSHVPQSRSPSPEFHSQYRHSSPLGPLLI